MRPMNFGFLVIGAILLLSMLSTGCAMNAQLPDKTNNSTGIIRLKPSDSGKSVDAQVGDIIEISLKDNPSTGYQWAIEQGEEQSVEMQSTETPRADSAETMGAGGQRIFSFTLKKPGRLTVRLKRWRAWEGDSSVVERFDITLNVKP